MAKVRYRLSLAAATAGLLLVQTRISFASTAAAPHAMSASTLGFFSVFFVLVVAVCVWAARKANSTHEYLAAGSSITPAQNGLAIAGDYMSAGAFLGLTGAIFASGLDGLFLAATYLASWPIVLFLVAEPLRRLGKYSLADVVAHRLEQRPIRILSAVCSLIIVCFYLVAQLVGAGELIGLLIGVSYRSAVFVAGIGMVAFAILGGMRGATWIQIIKAVLMLAGGAVIAALCLSRFGFNLTSMVRAATNAHPAGHAIVDLRSFARNWPATVSLAIGVLFGTAGLPHVLMRFLTVRDERAARLSVFYATCLIGLFFLMLLPIGFGSISILRDTAGYVSAGGQVRGGSNMVALNIAGIVGGHILLGYISAVAFATILAVVSGLIIAGASSATNDLVASIRGGEADERSRLMTVRMTAAILGLVSVLLAIAFEGQNVAYLIALATAIAGSANFPLLMLAIYWRGLTTAGAVIGGSFGLASSVLLTILGPTVWTKVLGFGPAIFPYDSPAILTVPATFLVCIAASRYGRRAATTTSTSVVS